MVITWCQGKAHSLRHSMWSRTWLQANHLGRQGHDEIHSGRCGYAGYLHTLVRRSTASTEGERGRQYKSVPVPVPMLMPMRSHRVQQWSEVPRPSIMMMEYGILDAWRCIRVVTGGAPAANLERHFPRVNLPRPSFLAEGLRFSFSTSGEINMGWAWMGELCSVQRGSSARNSH